MLQFLWVRNSRLASLGPSGLERLLMWPSRQRGWGLRRPDCSWSAPFQAHDCGCRWSLLFSEWWLEASVSLHVGFFTGWHESGDIAGGFPTAMRERQTERQKDRKTETGGCCLVPKTFVFQNVCFSLHPSFLCNTCFILHPVMGSWVTYA